MPIKFAFSWVHSVALLFDAAGYVECLCMLACLLCNTYSDTMYSDPAFTMYLHCSPGAIYITDSLWEQLFYFAMNMHPNFDTLKSHTVCHNRDRVCLHFRRSYTCNHVAGHQNACGTALVHTSVVSLTHEVESHVRNMADAHDVCSTCSHTWYRDLKIPNMAMEWYIQRTYSLKGPRVKHSNITAWYAAAFLIISCSQGLLVTHFLVTPVHWTLYTFRVHEESIKDIPPIYHRTEDIIHSAKL